MCATIKTHTNPTPQEDPLTTHILLPGHLVTVHDHTAKINGTFRARVTPAPQYRALIAKGKGIPADFNTDPAALGAALVPLTVAEERRCSESSAVLAYVGEKIRIQGYNGLWQILPCTGDRLAYLGPA